MNTIWNNADITFTLIATIVVLLIMLYTIAMINRQLRLLQYQVSVIETDLKLIEEQLKLVSNRDKIDLSKVKPIAAD